MAWKRKEGITEKKKNKQFNEPISKANIEFKKFLFFETGKHLYFNMFITSFMTSLNRNRLFNIQIIQ